MRFSWSRQYAEGKSMLYAYWDVSSDEIMVHSMLGGNCLIKREDFFELIMSVLRKAQVFLTNEEIKRIADYLEVKLNKRMAELLRRRK